MRGTPASFSMPIVTLKLAAHRGLSLMTETTRETPDCKRSPQQVEHGMNGQT